jgi:pimeloyl-ACP methyl ester carboxylesterase
LISHSCRERIPTFAGAATLRLMGTDSHRRHTVDLAGGALDYLEAGPSDAPAVIVLDGYGSRLMGEMAAARADHDGVRVISPDRPGYWASARRSGDPLESWPTACRELLDHLGLEAASLLGSSAGCPLTFSTAAALATRVARVAIVGPISPFADANGMPDMHPAQRRSFQMAARLPSVGGASMRMMGIVGRRAPSRLLRMVASQRPEVDARRMEQEDLRSLMLESVPGLMGRAASADMKALASDWRDLVDTTTQPVRIWVGSLDSVHPKSMAHGLADRLSNAETTVVEGGFFDCTDRLDEILGWTAGRSD